jgi:hypothetical protein
MPNNLRVQGVLHNAAYPPDTQFSPPGKHIKVQLAKDSSPSTASSRLRLINIDLVNYLLRRVLFKGPNDFEMTFDSRRYQTVCRRAYSDLISTGTPRRIPIHLSPGCGSKGYPQVRKRGSESEPKRGQD